MKSYKNYFIFIFVSLSISLSAQDDNKSLLSIERIFNSNEFRSGSFGPARWIEKGEYYTTIEASKEFSDGSDIVKYETISGEREILVSSNLLIPDGDKKPLSINNYIWSLDGKLLLIFTNTKRVWRYNTKGDYWVLNLDSKKLLKLGSDKKKSELMCKRLSSPNSKSSIVANNISI